MASVGDPTNTAVAAANIFNEDEDLIDEDDEESFDRDEDDSASSAALAVDRPLPFPSAAQVTVAFPDPHLRLQQPDHHQQELVVAKKPKPPDESRKLFQRLWTDEDEIELLQGFLDYTTQRFGAHNSSQHHHDTTAFYDQIKSRFQLDFNKNQLVEKLRRLKKKYRNVVSKFASGKDYTFKSSHEQATFEISSKIWGNIAVVNGYPALPAAPAPIVEEDDDDLNNHNFAYFQSPKSNGIDINSKTPRPKKRNRAGVVKIEEKHQHANPITTINNTQVTPMAAPAIMGATPVASPAMGSMGVTGSMPSVIEETVKSCLSPIIKELFSNSMSLSPNPNSPCCGHNGFGLTQNLLPFCFNTAIGGDKVANNNRWKKQQMLELEVFSKRLELVQDQIREQLQELKSMGD